MAGKRGSNISNILYSDKNAFIRLPQLHIAGLLYSGLEPPISSKLLLPKLQYNLGSLMVSLDPSLDQGHNEIVLQSMVHVCPFKFRLGMAATYCQCAWTGSEVY